MIDVQGLRRENAELRRQLLELMATNARLTEQLAKLNDRVGELLAFAQRKQRKAPAQKPPAPPPIVPEDARRSASHHVPLS